MTSYIPEFVYGDIPGTYGEKGLMPWPAHMTPVTANVRSEPVTGRNSNEASSDVDLTKKGEAYVAAALAEANGVFFVTVDAKDRSAIATSIEKLINILDDLEPDSDLEPDLDGEPVLGWTAQGQGISDDGDREADQCDGEATALERHGKGFVASGADDSEANGDDEPWLGNGGSYIDSGLQYDLELDNADAEPSLAATEAINQDAAWRVPQDQWNIEDAEERCDDEGAIECDIDDGQYDPPGVIWGGGSHDSGRVPT